MRVPSEGREGLGQRIGICRPGENAPMKIEIRPLLGIGISIFF